MNTNKQIYLDYAASTPVDDEVLHSMLPYFSNDFGNASSIHYFGQKAEAAIERSRMELAGQLNCEPDEIIFTSGGTESDNLAIRGTAFAEKRRKKASKILISPVEHHAVAKTAEDLAKYFGFTVEYLPVDSTGAVVLEEVERRIDEKTAIVSVIYGNNEIGTINPIEELTRICHAKGVSFHSDAVQAGGYLPIDLQKVGIDLLSLGAHKFYGPKGVGVLYIRKGLRIQNIQTGGSHEFGMRAGTQNTAYIAGMAKAYKITRKYLDSYNQKYRKQVRYLFDHLTQKISGIHKTGADLNKRLPNHLSLVFEGVDGNQLVAILAQKGFAVSSGSACKTGSPEPSGVLLAMGIDPELAMGSLRITLGRQTTDQELNEFIPALRDAVEVCRK